MRILLAISASSLAALAVQPFILFLWAFLPLVVQGAELPWDQVGTMSFLVMVFAVPFVLLLGVPLTLLLHRLGRLKWWPLCIAGTLAGAAFAGWSGPGSDLGSSYGGNWYGSHVEFVVNGQPTLYGWLSYLQSVAAFSLHGLAGATVFFLVWRHHLGPDNSSKPNPLRGSA